MIDTSILTPAVTLVLLHILVLLWMYAKRIPAMNAAKMDPQDAAHTSELSKLPNPARQIGDNYNHLFEQPVLFYVLVLVIAIAGHTDALHLYCAWGFVLGRAIHTLIQGTYNKVMHRFSIFMLCWVLLTIMAVRELLALLATTAS